MKTKLCYIVAMLIFGSIGIFITKMEMPSIYIVQWRTIIGSLCLIGYMGIKKHKMNWSALRNNIKPLLISGFVLGCNWVCLFEAYKYTSVGIATIFYYLAPIMVFCVAPFVFKEKITKSQIIGILSAVVGMILVNLSGIGREGFSIQILYAVFAAILYATVMIANKFVKNMSGVESTAVQLVISCVVMSCYCTFTVGKLIYIPQGQNILLIILVGMIHTGLAYALYIGAMQKLSPQNIAIFSYIDPASALLFAFIFLNESLSIVQILGAILIFGGALFAQMKDA